MKPCFFKVCLASSIFAKLSFGSDLAVDGNLTVTGQADIQGNIATVGSWAGDTTHAGLTFQYSETSGASTITFDASRNTNSWFWRHNTASGLIPGMQLDDTHRLTLFASDGATAGVILDPAGASTIAGSLVINGTSITLPNQTLAGASSVLTQGLADTRYLRQGGSTWTVGSSASATGTGSFALGNGAVSVGDGTAESIAFGTGAVAYTSTNYGDHCAGIAIGYQANAGSNTSNGGGVAIGMQAQSHVGGVAIGRGAQASDYYDIAIGLNTHANGGNSTAIGDSSTASSYNSVVLGTYLQSYGAYETVVGFCNAAEPGANWVSRVATDNCFVVANGDIGAASNAFAIQWNGDATMYGNAHVTKAITADQGANFTGDVQVTGDLQIGGKATVQPKGGISMGIYTAP